jgi:hypothetical protein
MVECSREDLLEHAGPACPGVQFQTDRVSRAMKHLKYGMENNLMVKEYNISQFGRKVV